ncbi:hypothetical protein V8E51_013612 [Hyaloscypha variabilis]
MFSRSSSSHSQNPRLRASCDTCFLAKIKCSKARPMCSRCLAFGTECNYSPSSRAGKPKSDHKGSRPSKKHRSTSDDSAIFSSSEYSPSLHIDTEEPTSYFPEADWSTTPTSEVDGYEAHHFMSPPIIPVFGDQSSSESSSSASSADAYDSYSFWTHNSPTYINSPYIHNIDYLTPEDITEPSISPTTPWVDPNSYQFSNSDPRDPRLASNPNLFMDECLARTTTCNCFNACLEVLQTLHNFNAVPPASSFDIVLTVNQKAMEICATTLSCSICNSRSGSNHHTMLLGTILGRIILIYQDASRDYFGPASEPGSHPLPLTFGVYRVASEDIRWMQLVIILRDLKKFKGLLSRFQKTAKGSEAEEDIDMHRAVTNRLYQSLNLTCHALKKHKDFSWGHVD